MLRAVPLPVALCLSLLAGLLVSVLSPSEADAAPLSFTDINPDTSDNPNRLSSTGGRVNGLASASGNNQVFYAASEWGGLYKTTNGGSSWFRLNAHLPTVMWDVEVDPTNNNRVYATSFYDGLATSGSGIQVSGNAGTSWTHPSSANPPATFPDGATCAVARRTEPSSFGIAIHPGNGAVYVGTNCGVARSTNGGSTWTFVDPKNATTSPAGGQATDVWDVWVQDDGSANGIVDVCGADGVWRSTNGGATWTNIAGDLPLGVAFGRCSIAASPDESYVLFVEFGGRFFQSNNAGTNWVEFAGASNGTRIPFLTSSQRADSGDTNQFSLWIGRGVSLFRADCTTPTPPGQGGANRCPAVGSWTNAHANAHDDTGDLVFDTAVPGDPCPRIYSNDGGVYSNTDADPTSCHTPNWTRANVGVHGLWLYAMAGADQSGVASEDLYMGTQDVGSMASTNAGAASPTWTNPDCCDVFNIVADGNRVVWDAFAPYGQFRGGPGMSARTGVNGQPPGCCTQGFALFNFPDWLAQYGPNNYVGVTNQGAFFTNDITANPVTWQTLGTSAPGGGFCAVQAAVSGGTPTFYAQTQCLGVFENTTPGQLWRAVGTGGAWQRVDNNPLVSGGNLAGGIEIFAVDPNDPNRLYASNVGGPNGARMVFSDDGGATWDFDPGLDDLMMGGGDFPMSASRGPLSFTGFGTYRQPTLVAFDPEDPNVLVAGGRESGVFISSNQGQDWALLTDPRTPHISGVPHLPRPHYAYFDHEPSGGVSLFIGTQGRGVWRINVPEVDLSLTKQDAPDPVVAGTNLTYTIEVTNNSTTDPAANVSMVDPLPANTTFQSIMAPGGWSCTTPSVGAGGTVECTAPSLAAQATAQFVITVRVDPATPFGTVLSNTARTWSNAIDDDQSNNFGTTETTVERESDLEIVEFEALSPPVEMIIGEPQDVTLHKVITNRGPSYPTDVRVIRTASATAGATVVPTMTSHVEDAVSLDEMRVVDEDFTIECTAPGPQTFTFENEIEPADPNDVDPDLSNNTAMESFSVECIVPVAINIHPGSFRNPVNLKVNGVITVAVLTTEAGEYGLPLAFDATTIDASTVRFGPEAVVNSGGGAPESHGRGHIEDAIERSDESTRDGDLDMVLHFRTKLTGLSETDDEACVRGMFGMGFVFLGCDVVDTF